jgi:hypothetical protein
MLRPLWLLDQPHFSLLWRTAGLLVVAVKTRSHDIFPACLSALRPWNHVVIVELARWQLHAAVLALEVVAQKYVHPGKPDCSTPTDTLQQPNDGRHLHHKRDSSHILVIAFDNLRHVSEDHRNCTLPAHNPVWLVSLVQNKYPGRHDPPTYLENRTKKVGS